MAGWRPCIKVSLLPVGAERNLVGAELLPLWSESAFILVGFLLCCVLCVCVSSRPPSPSLPHSSDIQQWNRLSLVCLWLQRCWSCRQTLAFCLLIFSKQEEDHYSVHSQSLLRNSLKNTWILEHLLSVRGDNSAVHHHFICPPVCPSNPIIRI